MSDQHTTPPETIALARPARHPVSLRALLLGLIGVVFITGLAPFNDYVMRNGVLIGGALPIGVVLFVVVFQLLINGPLSRFRPSWAFSTGEVVTILLMLLVACVIPTSGLMRFWPATLTGPWYHSRTESGFGEIFDILKLPAWYWPTFQSDAMIDRQNDPVVRYFYNLKLTNSDQSWSEIVFAWIPPFLGWGVFFGAMAMCLLGLSFIVGKQWIDNERIAFPIAQVHTALVQAPSPGRWLSETFSSRSFWIAVGLILAVRTLTGLHAYFPNVPEIELAFNLRALFADPPLSYVEGHVTLQTIFPLVIALTFFVSTRISLSLWAFVLLWQPPLVLMEQQGARPTTDSLKFFQLGSLIAFFLMVLWTGRQHYINTLRLMFRPARAGEETGSIISFRLAGWMALVGFIGAVAWLMVCNMPWYGAVFLIGSLVIVWVVMANVVAHSGMPVPTIMSGPREWSLPIMANADPVKAYNLGHVLSQYHIQAVGGMFATASDQLLVYSTHAEKVVRTEAPNIGRRILLAIVLSLGVGYVVGTYANLWNYYHIAASLDSPPQSPINAEVLDGQPKWTFTHMTRVHKTGAAPRTPESIPWWIGGGAALTGVLAYLQLTVSWWPLHPIGLLMCFSFPLRRIWFSIFLGWLIKLLMVKYGGSRLFTLAKPFFLGIIVGEVLANGLFGGLAILLMSLGIEYKAINFLPVSQF